MLRIIGYLFGVGLLFGLLAIAGTLWVFWEYGRDLPDYNQLANYEPPVMTRVHAGDGRMLAEYAIQSRVFVPAEAIPRRVIEAFVAAEDKNFFHHPGIDPLGIVRAAVTNLRNIGTGRRPVGASTVTQQVAQNFLLAKELSYTRKIKEAILAFRIERAYTKDQILELYLNEIYLGRGAYGVAAASIKYFGRSLDELSVAEVAFLAALPKAPSNYDPTRRPEAARARRNYVLGRMLEDGFIDAAEAQGARITDISVSGRDPAERVEADYFAEEVRRELVTRYGESALYEGGLSVRTTLQPHLQDLADRALTDGLIAYDRRHGWRGPVAQLPGFDAWPDQLAAIVPPTRYGEWRLAAVLTVEVDQVEIGFSNRSAGVIPLSELTWARPWLAGQRLGPKVEKPADVLAAGDVVLVERVEANAEGEPYPDSTFALRQVPEVQGGIVALDPHTGRVLAMSGGFDFSMSEFNRATQALRQPGSAFKPFVYMAALDAGFTPSTLILDAPFVIDQGPGLGKWKPANYTKNFYGPSPMRLGIEKSRNLMTVRLAQTVGMESVADYAERFGVVDDLPEQLSMAIGAGETTLLRLTTAYAMMVNGGRRITPTLIDRIQNRHGLTVLRHDSRPCTACQAGPWNNQAPPSLPDSRESVVDSRTAYQMVSMLQGVVERGTGRRISAIGKPLAGKTGTTNDSFDSWFVGFSPDLAVGAYIGFDTPRSLGNGETGSSVAAPVFQQFMAGALVDQPSIPFRIPEGIRLVRVNGETGLVAKAGERHVILEAFKPGRVPQRAGPVIDGGYSVQGTANATTGGIY